MEIEIIGALVQGTPTVGAVAALYVAINGRLVRLETHIKHLLGRDI